MNLFADFYKFFKCRLFNKNSRKSAENLSEKLTPRRLSAKTHYFLGQCTSNHCSTHGQLSWGGAKLNPKLDN